MFRAIREFLTFRRMIGPFVLQILFWGAAVMVVAFGLRELDSGDKMIGWTVIVFGLLALRLVFELVLLAFRMYDRLGQIKNVLESVDEATRPISVMEPDTVRIADEVDDD